MTRPTPGEGLSWTVTLRAETGRREAQNERSWSGGNDDPRGRRYGSGARNCGAPHWRQSGRRCFPLEAAQRHPSGDVVHRPRICDEQACRSDGKNAARELTATNCSATACAVPVWCVDKRTALISVFPGTAAPLKLQCHPGYYGVAPGATKPAQHPQWCEYVSQ